MDLLTGARVVYALRRVPDGGPAYEFVDQGLRFGCAAIRRGIESAAAVLVIDEIGPLEMAGGGLWQPVRQAASGFPGRIMLTVRPVLVEEILTRLELASRDVEVVTTR